MMNITVHRVQPGSIAEELDLQPGDVVLAVNGKQTLEDLLDYQFEILDSAYTELWVRHTDGSEEIYEIDKDPEDDLGLQFTSPIFTPIKTCNNACPFCFIDQQPEGLRPSLYVKDDDYRLSYFNNTYITLTNLTVRDRQRIETLRPGPLYISVHSTVPEVRIELLKNKKAGEILTELTWLKSLDIPFHCQIVLCPGLNDGPALTQTLEDLQRLQPACLSVAVVPLGLTQHRDALPALTPVSAESAEAVIDRVETFQKLHPGFVYLSDEFYLKTQRTMPQYEAYGEFPQLDDGVGTARMLLKDFFEQENRLPKAISSPANYLVITGELAKLTLAPMVNRLNEIDGLYVDVLAVENNFWGQAVTVAGLITGCDILAQLTQLSLEGYTAAIIPSVMLKQGTDRFLDDVSVADLEAKTGLPFKVIADPYSASAFLEALAL